jgi:hypothetical protein
LKTVIATADESGPAISASITMLEKERELTTVAAFDALVQQTEISVPSGCYAERDLPQVAVMTGPSPTPRSEYFTSLE